MPDESAIVPRVEESLDVQKETVETGRVRVYKKTVEEPVSFEQDLLTEEYEVRHVQINRAVRQTTGIRHEGDTTIIPVYEEVAVVTKKLMLREEVHLIRRRRQTHSRETTTLKKDKIRVERIRPGPE